MTLDRALHAAESTWRPLQGTSKIRRTGVAHIQPDPPGPLITVLNVSRLSPDLPADIIHDQFFSRRVSGRERRVPGPRWWIVAGRGGTGRNGTKAGALSRLTLCGCSQQKQCLMTREPQAGAEGPRGKRRARREECNGHAGADTG